MEIAWIPQKMPYVRLGYAVAALFTPKLAAAAILAKPKEMTPAAVSWAALTATREAALGVVTLEGRRLDPVTRRKVLLLNAAVDGVDSLVFLAHGLRRRSILPLLAVPVGVLSAIAHVQAARELDGAPGATGTEFENAYVTA